MSGRSSRTSSTSMPTWLGRHRVHGSQPGRLALPLPQADAHDRRHGLGRKGRLMRGVEQIPWLYDVICSLYERSGIAEWRHWLVAGAHGRVLDLGTGTGRNLPLLPRGSKAVAVDPSLDALKRARHRAPTVPLVRARAEALPFRDQSFDTVLSGLVFCSVEEPARGLAEVKRVLRPEGRLRMRACPFARAMARPIAGFHPTRLDLGGRRMPSE